MALSSPRGFDGRPGIVEAISALNDRDDIDVMIVAWGGGEIEDLARIVSPSS